jgi:hypothetical protein
MTSWPVGPDAGSERRAPHRGPECSRSGSRRLGGARRSIEPIGIIDGDGDPARRRRTVTHSHSGPPEFDAGRLVEAGAKRRPQLAEASGGSPRTRSRQSRSSTVSDGSTGLWSGICRLPRGRLEPALRSRRIRMRGAWCPRRCARSPRRLRQPATTGRRARSRPHRRQFRRPAEGLGTSRPAGEVLRRLLDDVTAMAIEGLQQRTTLSRGGRE